MKIRPLVVQKKGDGRTVALDLFGTQRQQQLFNASRLDRFPKPVRSMLQQMTPSFWFEPSNTGELQ